MSELNRVMDASNRIAVTFLTVWMEKDKLTAADYIDTILNDPNGPGVPSIIAGQLNVGRALVVMLARAQGAETEDEIRLMAGQILQDVAGEVAQ
jgi:hypothetical protein